MRTSTARMQSFAVGMRSSWPWTGSAAIGSSRRLASVQVSQMARHPRQTPALSMPCTFSPRPIASVAAVNEREAGFAYSSNDALQQQVHVLNEEAKEVAAKLDAARAALLKEPGNQDLRHMVQKLEVKEAGLDEMRKTLVATLSAGATTGVNGAGRTLLICELHPDDEVTTYRKKFKSPAALKDWLQRGGQRGIYAEADYEKEPRTMLDDGDWEELEDEGRYVLPYSPSLTSLDKILGDARRYQGNQERGKEDEFGKAMLSDVTKHGTRAACLRPDLRRIKDANNDKDLQEIDAVVLEDNTAHVGYRVANATVQDVGEATKSILMIAARSKEVEKWPSYAPFQGKVIRGSFMFDSVATKARFEDVHAACVRNAMDLYLRDGRDISRVP